MTSPILREATKLLLPVFIIMSVFLLLRGHHLPGGGFAGGLVAATGICFAAVVQGRQSMRAIVGCNLRWFIGGGLIIALISAALPLLQGSPFFTGLWTKITVLPGESLKVGTPLLFDVGVYFMVVGVTCTFVQALLADQDEPAQELAPAAAAEGKE